MQKKTQNYFVKPNDILISMTGSGIHAPDSMVGRVARYTGKNNQFLINQRVGRFVINHLEKLDTRYLFFVLTQSEYQWELVSIATGSANQVNISAKQIESLEIPLPPLPEQKAIASILSSLDDKIELNQQMNQTLEAMARAIFKSWFVDFDPVRAKMAGNQPVGMDAATANLFPDSFKESALGLIPKGWKVGTVGEEFNLTMGQSPPSSTYNENGDGIAFYQGRRDFGFRYPTIRVYCNAPTRYAKYGDTLVSVRAPVGDINLAHEKCCIGRGLAAIRHKTDSRSYTYYSMLNLNDDFATYESDGTVFGSISKQSFSDLTRIVPAKLIIIKFENLTYSLDQTIENNENQSRTLANIRDTLLPKLMSAGIKSIKV